MGIIANIKRAVAAYRQAPLRSGDDIAMVTARPSDLSAGTRYRQLEQLQLIFKYGKWVRVAASRNASAVAAVPIRVYRQSTGKNGLRTAKLSEHQTKRLTEDSGRFARKSFGTYRTGWEEITDTRHPLVALLGQANSEVNGYELIESCQLFMELAGNAFWWKEPGTQGYPRALWNLFPQYCEVVPDSTGAVSFYNYGRPEQKRRIDPSECMHFKFPSPFDPYYGHSPLAACFEEAEISDKLSLFAKGFLDNGIVGGANVFAPGLPKDQSEELQRELERKYSGPVQANKWRIWRAKDMRVEYPPQLDKNPIMAESENMARNMIAAAFDLPVGLLNMEERSLANGKVVAPHWQLLSIKPRCQRLEDKINENLVPDFRAALGDDSLIVAFDNPVAEDRQALVLEVTTLAGGKPIITQDEARAQLGLAPLTPEQKEELKPPAQPDPWGMGGDGGGTGGTNDDSQRDGAKALMWSGDPHDHEHGTKKLPKVVQLSAAQLSAALNRIFNAFVPQYAANPVNSGLGLEASIGNAMKAEVYRATEVPMVDVFLHGFNEGVDAINDRGGEMERADALTQDAQKFLDGYRIKLADRVVQTYEGRIRAILQTTLREGGTVQTAAAQIRTQVPVEAPYAALRIARTETNRAMNAGKDEAAKESPDGLIVGKEWLLSGNPCKVCKAIAEQHKYAKIGEPFVKRGTMVAGKVMDYGDVDGGDGHPNCSCQVGYVYAKEYSVT